MSAAAPGEIALAPRPASHFWFACVDLKVIRDPELSPFDKAVFVVLCSHADTSTRHCRLKMKTIAAEASCSERSVRASLRKLEERGVIVSRPVFVDGQQRASVYEIVGWEAPCYADAPARAAGDAALGRQEVPGGAAGDAARINESPSNENPMDEIDLPPTGAARAAAPEGHDPSREGEPPREDVPSAPPSAPQEVPLLPVTEAPEAMRHTAELLLFKTGRKGLTEGEISALRVLAVRHFPERVNREVSRAVERWGARGKPLSGLTFEYIADALKHQVSRGPRPPAGRPPERPFDDPDEPMLTEEDLARIEAKLKGGGCG